MIIDGKKLSEKLIEEIKTERSGGLMAPPKVEEEVVEEIV